jgi:midasin
VEGSGALSVVVQGPSGCGKTSLLRDYFSLCGRTVGDSVMVVHLGEQIDSKVLLGTFTCTAVPGEFVWMPGLLTKCVLNGHWIVLEDIDFAPPDVISLLLPLVKTRRLNLPGYYEPVVSARDFKLFLTQRTASTGGLEAGHMVAGLLKVLEDHSVTLTLPPHTTDDIEKVISSEYPDLESFTKQLALTVVEQGVSLRHVLKLCNRIVPQVAHGRLTSVPDMMLDVLDCFCGHLSGEKKLSKALKLSHLCGGLTQNMVEQLCFSHMPSLQTSPSTFSVGRSYIGRSRSSQSKVCYSHTQSSLSLLEAVSRCVQMAEPVLLVGETGVGKTATVSYLASVTGHKLVVMNLSQQTDSIDLLGGYKPVQMVHIVAPLKEEFEELFRATFSLKQNAHFLASVQTCVTKKQWKKLLKLMVHSVESAQKRTKRSDKNMYAKWGKLGLKLKKLRQQLLKSQTFAFTFDEGALVEAVKEGWWILLDEVNLASAESLQCLSAILEAHSNSLLFMEKPDSEPVTRHPDFRLFCCMNPSTDVGKKSLPENIRNRFTELYVEEPTSTADLSVMIQDYLKNDCPSNSLVEGIVRLYRSLKELSKNKLLGGTGRSPHYSLRNLCRALEYASNHRCGSFHRSLYEGFCMSFLTELCQDHHQIVVAEIVKCLSLSEAVLTSLPPAPRGTQRGVVQVAGYWLPIGEENPVGDEKYILTPSVKRNLHNLSRVVSARKYPVLLQGPTSAGKTSLVKYLAKATGHHCLRINNHEHTDLQEYIGMYCADENGELVFQEGVLVEAMRKGYWIILDELNLAPTDVLEALNRVLDDNRELFIPETRKLVKAHPQFMLFGTQNPPGAYGGRKVLSRAFRNRFIELHYDDIPSGELVNIVHEKSSLPLSYAKRMVAVMKELQVRRTASGVFSGKYGLITLRDLFRWAERYRRSPTSSSQFRDWEQQLAEDGFMLLAGRLREVNDEQVVLDVIQRHFKRKVEPIQLYGEDGGQGSLASQECLQLLRAPLTEEFRHLVWTSAFLRMAVLTFRALSFDEPVLLVGHTGCGKTTLCQLFSSILGRKLVSINCHMHSEAADFLGGLKPTRSRGSSELRVEKVGLFEWQDGVVVKAMQEGCSLLVDEISLADDAVLERLNSVLETERRLLVSERSRSQGQAEVFQITASPGFAFMATMNPGGDYGKKELSPALRNRFVELWCPSSRKDEDLAKIIDHNLNVSPNSGIIWSSLILHTIHWIKGKLPFDSIQVSVRDLLTWVRFMNATSPPLPPAEAFYHGAHLVLLDSLGCREQLSVTVREHLLQGAQMFLQELLVKNGRQMSLQSSPASISCHEDMFGIHPFFIKKGPYECKGLQYYSLDAPGPCGNAYRLLRGMQVGKPLLIEGPPGVGKTSLVAALASYGGHHLTRINLSEHTDISDLFGCDLPVEGGRGVRFQWRDGPLLRALKTGDWVLLDEINLASQSVLEGLNAVLDHRGEVFVPELGITFSVQPNTKLFACQNPMSQGGGRKGLPKSFLNRFTMVFVDVLSESDFQFISHSLYPDIDLSVLQNMITFNSKVEALVKRERGTSLWEFNLRDILRWCQVLKDHQIADPGQLVDLIYCRRLRSASLRAQVVEVYGEVFCDSSPLPTTLGGSFVVTEEYLQVGHAVLARRPYDCQKKIEGVPLQALHCQLPVLEAVMMCVSRGWMTILVGGRASGKTSVVRTLAQLVGQKLVEFPMNSDTDTTELLGGFQQVNFGRHFYNIVKMVEDVLVELMATIRHHQNGREYTAKLRAMKNSSLPKVSGVLQEVSNVELLDGCEKLKQCLVVMEEVSSHLPTNLSYDVGEILSQVVWLKDRIQQGDSGGQFEWVDSVLVTSLRHGHWLCITNCNVCNPSVLDRLNALVEPGGVLSVDERGVVGEEGVMTVKPHPNFRLFLLMDPAHGEISRAMRNRGIEVCILPEETLGSVNRNKEDWRSLLLSAGVDSNTANHVLTSVAEESVSPVRLLQGVYCSSMVSQRPVKSNWKHLEVPQLPVVCESSGSSSDLPSQVSAICQHPDAVTVQSHFSVILKVIGSHSSNEHGRNHKIMDVDAALQVFTSHASVSDYHMRKGLMTTLVSLCASDYHFAGVAHAWCTSLQEYADKKAHVAIERGDFTYNVPNLLSISNPMVTSLASTRLKSLTLKEKMLVFGTRITSLKELLQWHSKFGTSTLCVSYQAYTGQLQLETLIHPSLQLIQPFLSVFIDHLSSTLVSADRDTNMLQEVVEWLAVIIHCFSHPVHSLTELAGVWTVFKTRCISPSSAASKSELVTLMSSLQPLEKVVHDCCFFAEVRDSFCQSGNSTKHCNPLSSEKEKIGSISCFKELSSEDTICTVGTYQHKVDQMKILLSTLWMNGCSVSNTPLANLQQKLMLANSLLRSTVAALGRALKFPDLTGWCTGEHQLLSESLSELCCEAQRACPDHSGPQFWQRLCHQISAAFNELASVKESLEMAFGDLGGNRDLHGELTLLCGLSTGCVHVGAVVTNLLLPTAIDPVSLKEVDYKCYQMLAAQQSAVVKACDAHYLTTTGKTLGVLMRARSPIDTVLPGRRGGISPYVSYVVERKEFCEKLFQRQKPPVSSSSAREKYSLMVSVCTDVIHTFCSSERVASLLQDASVATQDSFSRVETWSKALRAAVDKLHSEFPSLEDVVKPFTTGLLQTVAGVISLMSFRLAILSPQLKLLPVLRDSSQFPFSTTENGTGSAAFILQLLDSLTVITEDISALKESERQQFHKRMLLIGVKFSKCFISHYSKTTSCTTLSRRWYSLCSTLLKYCWLLWNRAEQANRAKMEEESSLYRYRTKTHDISLLGEGEVDDEVVRQIFPIYDEQFEELSGKEDSSKDDTQMEADEGVQEVSQFTHSEMREVFDLHQQLFTPQSRSQHHPYQLFDTMRARYSFAAALAHNFDHLPGLSTDYCLFGAHARMCKDMLTELTRELPLKQRNIYKESVVSEAVKVGPVVNGLKERVEELLVEWPDHPGLVQVRVSCEKVLSLSVQEPLMKILAGLEYILRKSQDWEAYAASHVSLRQQLDQLTQLILDWRRLELRSWRSLFEECSSGVQCEGSKWWFHIYSLCQESISGHHGNIKELLESVHEFVEVASLGEFTIRLKLLRSFATDMFLQGHPTLGNLLANTVNYYQQFAPLVTSHSSKLTAVIDKEFNDHVRIMRWNDGNYWALKASTENSHRTLVKFMRKLKGALSEPVRPLLTAGALQTSDPNEESCLDNKQLKIPHIVDLESTELNLTVCA